MRSGFFADRQRLAEYDAGRHTSYRLDTSRLLPAYVLHFSPKSYFSASFTVRANNGDTPNDNRSPSVVYRA
jgi:hypothetical protein